MEIPRAPYGTADASKWNAWAERILALPCVKHIHFVKDCEDCIASREKFGKENW
jgi:hypothetical protein